jgi:transcription-repair coupling factor (superfamily II helicase)
MPLENVLQTIRPELTGLLTDIEQQNDLPNMGLRHSARLPVLAVLAANLSQPLVLLTTRTDHALGLFEEFYFWAPAIPRLFFPEPTPLFYENAPYGLTTRRDRLNTLSTLAAYHVPTAPRPLIPPIIIVPIRAAMTRTLPRREFLKATRSYKIGQIVKLDELLHNWVSLGYSPATIVIEVGQFTRRGGILDIWPPVEPHPVRIEFFGDEIDTLRYFNPATQRTFQSFERLQITPAREFITSPDAIDRVKSKFKYTPQEDLPLSEFHIPLLHPSHSCMLDYLPRQAVVILDDLGALQETASEIEEQAVGLRKDYIDDGTLPANFPTPYLSWSEMEDALTGMSSINLSSDYDPDVEYSDHAHPLAAKFTPGPRFGGRLKQLIDHLLNITQKHEYVFIVSRQIARLGELWREHIPEDNPSHPEFIEGSLSEGWTFTPSSGSPIHLLTDGEIFGWRRPEVRQRHRPTAETPEAAYADLQAGDYVVHVDHGIGRFLDLVRRTVDGLEREYLCIEYAEGDQLFVPVYQADRLTRYFGPDNRLPELTRLGGTEWRSTKGRVNEAVIEVAQDLLELYAKRQVVQGFAFSSDTPWQKELEASFAYVETDDQIKVLEDVKTDMENMRPMDRLICGDVGYGKTEIALRAAFKAVMDGKQVAMLVPTTVLAQQHFNTFRERLAAFPAEVEMLSRFRTPQQQRVILRHLEQGKIDIIIGTHRLLQSDIRFKDLGLLIIDEEQRFGVTHKETLRKLRTEVDVLTLTATPIPRTLYMALTGVRDISTINTPPQERLPIITHVGPYSPRLVRHAILREMERGGQVFFVHNRVQTIQAMRQHLVRLLPEARISVAHGQMPEQVLSQRMESFTDGDIDILLSTSIIESGLDIPNANTLIVDRADTFGLAQLYQLRGRVGRGSQRAYAYFFRHRKKPPTVEGRERLETIAENTQLGAGFSIAMRDLEIRGTGDILGTRQHGHIAAVGFHLYTRLLADAVRQIRRAQNLPQTAVAPASNLLQVELRSPVTVDLPLNVGIPKDYVPDRDTRLRLYRRLADTQTISDVDELVAEFNDRFGPLPELLTNLLFQLKIKILAKKAGVSTVSSENGQIAIRYPPLPEGTSSRLFNITVPEIRVAKNSLWLAANGSDTWQNRLLAVLSELANI